MSDMKSNVKMLTIPAKLDQYGRSVERPKDPAKLIYYWLPDDPDCPDDLVVNAGSKPIIIGAPGGPGTVPQDSPRLDLGDRRQGAYYVNLIGLPAQLGIARVKDLSKERVRQLEKDRKIRTGELPPPWVIAARDRAARGEGPAPLADKTTAMSKLEKAALGISDE